MKNFGLLVVALCVAGCSKTSLPQNPEPAARPEATTSSGSTESTAQPSPQATKPAAATPAGQGVKTEMRNVLFHLTPKAAARIDSLSGELWPVGKFEMPVFDDKNSFEVHVADG